MNKNDRQERQGKAQEVGQVRMCKKSKRKLVAVGLSSDLALH